MEKNFTLLNGDALEKKYLAKEENIKAFDINSIFLGLIVITLITLAILLFLLIQKKMQELALTSMFA